MLLILKVAYYTILTLIFVILLDEMREDHELPH